MHKKRTIFLTSLLSLVAGLLVGFMMGVDWSKEQAVELPSVTSGKGLFNNGRQVGDLIANNQEVEVVPKVSLFSNKQMAVIGDSITASDGTTVNNLGSLTGYQEVFRQKGAKVTTYGYNGACYSWYDKKDSEHVHLSIYDKIVQGKVDFKQIEIVTLFAGTNDVSGKFPIGKKEDTTPETVLGGLNGIINYLKANNPTVKIFLFTPIYSGREDRKAADMEELAKGIMAVAAHQQLPVANLFKTTGITAENYDAYLYDQLHPNNDGLELIGNEMARFIEEELEKKQLNK